MARRVWLVTACGLVAAVSIAAVAQESPFRSVDDASRRAVDYFSKPARTPGKPQSAASAHPLAKSADESKPAAPVKTESTETTSGATATIDDEVPFGSTEGAKVDQTFQRLRVKSRATPGKTRVTLTAAEDAAAEEAEVPSARTPSGAKLSRSASKEEAASGIIHATHEAPETESPRIHRVSAGRRPSLDESENPFVPAEETLKNDPRYQKKPATRTDAAPKTELKPDPRTDSRKPLPPKSIDAKATEPKPADTKPTSTKTGGNLTELRGSPSRPTTSALRNEPRGSVTPAAHTPSRSEPTASHALLESSTAPTTSSILPNEPSASPQVMVRWVKRTEINVGQECECDLVVKNHGTVPANEVVVEATFPKTCRVTSSKPEPVEVSEHLSWKFASLAPGEEKSIRIAMIPSRKGELATSANVRFTGTAAGVFQVEEPMLALTLKGAKEVLVGDPTPQIITVSNPGSGVCQNVSVEAIVPKGLEHPRGERLQMDIGSLGPGESRTIRLALAAVAGGNCQVQVTARAAANLSQVATADVMVIAPSVKLALDGPSLRYIGRNATYVLSATNDGAAPSNNVRVMHKVPDGFTFVKADKGGKYDESNQTVSWFVGRLEPGQVVPVKVELAPTKLGTFVHRAGAVSERGARSETQFETVVDGTSALQLEIVEMADPVEVGAETMYEIRVKNNGSKASQNVGVACEMAGVVTLVSAKGPTEAHVDSGMVVFKSLPSLGAGKSVSYRVAVKATEEGSHRFRVRLASESITEPLISEELTKFYGE